MKNSVLGLFALLLVLFSQQALSNSALTENGHHLLEVCTEFVKVADDDRSANANNALICLGYINGFLEAYTYATNRSPSAKTFCAENIQRGQIGGAIVKYLNNNPQELQYSSGSVAWHALNEAFPCNK